MEKNDNLNDDDLFNRAKDYVNTQIELKKLTAIHSVVKVAGGVVSGLILAIVAIFFLIFLSLSAGFYFGEVLSSTYQGFLMVTLFYFVLAIILVLIRKNYITNPIVNVLIRKIFKKS